MRHVNSTSYNVQAEMYNGRHLINAKNPLYNGPPKGSDINIVKVPIGKSAQTSYAYDALTRNTLQSQQFWASHWDKFIVAHDQLMDKPGWYAPDTSIWIGQWTQ